MKRLAQLMVIVASVLLGGCYAHNFPAAHSFPQGTAQAPLPTYARQVFVDANGTFYPDGWPMFGLPRARWPRGSLYNQFYDAPYTSVAMDILHREEARQLAALADFAADKRRVFILVHGYNNSPRQAERPFEQIESLVQPGQDDAVIRFHWDGLVGSGAGAGKIWFNAVGNSQLAGSRGLRRILAQLSGKDIYLIAHSRGASVVLSALSNPPYDPDFAADTLGLARRWPLSDAREFLTPPAFINRNNRIRIMFAAPAIDVVDFCEPASPSVPEPIITDDNCRAFRPLGEHIISLRYTVNPADPVLDKFIGLASLFNPTRLGLNADVGHRLATDRYSRMCQYVFANPMRAHGFSDYIQRQEFQSMLAASLSDSPCVPMPDQQLP